MHLLCIYVWKFLLVWIKCFFSEWNAERMNHEKTIGFMSIFSTKSVQIKFKWIVLNVSPVSTKINTIFLFKPNDYYHHHHRQYEILKRSCWIRLLWWKQYYSMNIAHAAKMITKKRNYTRITPYEKRNSSFGFCVRK